MADAEKMADGAVGAKATEAAGGPGTGSAGDLLAELERKLSGFDQRIREKSDELKQLTARRRKVEQEIRDAKEKQLRDFIKSSQLDSFSPDAWRAAEAEIKAALERAGLK